ncbi:MAG: hypothetical protein AAGA77_24750 [Bacteroidota bacterium]
MTAKKTINKEENGTADPAPQEKKIEKLQCGIVMPISKTDGYPSGHWQEVYNIIAEAMEGTDFEVSMVSEESYIGSIHERIVNNLYSNELVIVDVSSNNPNVMFELGLRLAFDKATIIVIDDKTKFNFDINSIEHVVYNHTLRFSDINAFQEKLNEKALATYEASKVEGFSPYLKNFGTKIVPSQIDAKEVSDLKYIVDKINDIHSELNQSSSDKKSYKAIFKPALKGYGFELDHLKPLGLNKFEQFIEVLRRNFRKEGTIRLTDVLLKEITMLWNAEFSESISSDEMKGILQDISNWDKKLSFAM